MVLVLRMIAAALRCMKFVSSFARRVSLTLLCVFGHLPASLLPIVLVVDMPELSPRSISSLVQIKSSRANRLTTYKDVFLS